MTADGYADRQVDLIRRLEDLERHTTSAAGGGAAGFFTVASSDLSDELKARCDYVCTGVNDQDVINQALVDADEAELHSVVLVGGSFYCTDQILMFVSGTRSSLIGLPGANVASNLGTGGEVGLEFTWTDAAKACIVWTGRLANLNIHWEGTAPLALVSAQSGAEIIENVGFYGENSTAGTHAPGLTCNVNTRGMRIQNNFFYRCGTAVNITGTSTPIVDGNVFTNCYGHGIVLDTTGRAFVRNNVIRGLGATTNSDTYIAIDVADGNNSVIENNTISAGIEDGGTAKWLYGIRVQNGPVNTLLGLNTFLPSSVRVPENELWTDPGSIERTPLMDPAMSWFYVPSGTPVPGDLALFWDNTDPEVNANGDLRSCSLDELVGAGTQFARQKIYFLNSLVGTISGNDEMDLLDKSDTSENAAGTHRRVTITQLATVLTGASPIILPVTTGPSVGLELLSVASKNGDNSTTDIDQAVTWFDYTTPANPIAQLFAQTTGGQSWMYFTGFRDARLTFTAQKTSGALGSRLSLENDQIEIHGGAGITSVIAMLFDGGSKSFHLENGDCYIEDGFRSTVSLAVENAAFTETGFSFYADTAGVTLDPQSYLALREGKLYVDDIAGDYWWYDRPNTRTQFVGTHELRLSASAFVVDSPNLFAYTIEGQYNVKSYNKAGAGFDDANFVAYADDTPTIGFQDDSTSTKLVLVYNGAGDVLEVQDDAAAYKPINASAFNVSSSRATKTNIRPVDEIPGPLTPVRFERDGREFIGFIAEDVAPVLPTASDGRTIDYAQITAVQQLQINQLLERIEALESGR